jgi:hypothetical protein
VGQHRKEQKVVIQNLTLFLPTIFPHSFACDTGAANMMLSGLAADHSRKILINRNKHLNISAETNIPHRDIIYWTPSL